MAFDECVTGNPTGSSGTLGHRTLQYDLSGVNPWGVGSWIVDKLTHLTDVGDQALPQICLVLVVLEEAQPVEVCIATLAIPGRAGIVRGIFDWGDGALSRHGVSKQPKEDGVGDGRSEGITCAGCGTRNESATGADVMSGVCDGSADASQGQGWEGDRTVRVPACIRQLRDI